MDIRRGRLDTSSCCSSAQGPARGRRVCSSCRSGLFRPLRSPAWKALVYAGMSFKTEDQRGEVSGGCVSGHEGGVCWVPGVRLILQE